MAQKRYINGMITQIATWAAKAAVDEILQGKHKDIHTRCRGDAGMEHYRHNGHSPIYTYAEKVKSNIYITLKHS